MSKKRTTLYLSEEFHKTLKDICYREGVSMSVKVEELITPYVNQHSDGNPQTVLEFSGLPKTLPLYKTCRYSRKEKVKGEFYCECDTYKVKQGWKIPDACNRCKQYRPT